MGRALEHVGEVIAENIRTIEEARRVAAERRTRAQRVADAITGFAGSVASAIAHALLFGVWLLWNGGLLGDLPPWDPPPFVALAMFASVEAIFLTTFVLISQNRMAAVADQRADLDLQISLLAEHEITRVLALVDEIAKRMRVPRPEAQSLDALKQDVAPAEVLEELDRQGQ